MSDAVGGVNRPAPSSSPSPSSSPDGEEKSSPGILWFSQVGRADGARVGGKGASLGEMYQELVSKGVRVPDGFVTPVSLYRTFLTSPVPADAWGRVDGADSWGALRERAARATCLDEALQVLLRDAPAHDDTEMHARTRLAREFVLGTPLPEAVVAPIREGYRELCRRYGREVDAAVRSSATREDSTVASFAGQYESFLNIRGSEAVLDAWRRCAASAFTERAVSYQLGRRMDPLEGGVAVVIMKMVRSDIATSGVMFTLDPDSGNRNVIHLSSSYGLGELVVQGAVSPDTFILWKEGLRRGRPALIHRRLGAKDRKLVYAMQGGTATESVDVDAARQRQWSLAPDEALELGRMALTIEEHYGRPMDIEWAKDGYTGELFIVQARPETVHASGGDGSYVLETYRMDPELERDLEESGKILLRGHAVGTRIGTGRVRVYRDYEEVIVRKRELRGRLAEGEALEDIPPEERVFDPGDVLVTELTTPDWEPMMKEASLIVTEKGGRTSHAAIVAREWGIPAIVGCADATRILTPLQEVTGSCAQGDTGVVYEGIHPFRVDRVEMDADDTLSTRIKLNVGFPSRALVDAMLPSDGVGLARLEFILTAEVGVHPLALLYYEELRRFAEDGELAPALVPFEERLRAEDRHELRTLVGAIERRTPGYADRREFFVDRIRAGVALICAAFHPRPVLVRLSDLKSNEYRDLLGGRLFEPTEENPMIAWRGASRYVDPLFLPAFEMECDALRAVRQRLGLDNLQLMVPFCRTPAEGREVVRLLDQRGLSPQAGVPLFLMVELPSNVLEADGFIDEMELSGGSIGSNDLVQTVYAVSRDDLERYAHPDARSPAVQSMIRTAVGAFRTRGLEIGICGQAPSDHPDEVPAFLVECGITSISVTPDTVVRVRMAVGEAERALYRQGDPEATVGARLLPLHPPPEPT
jgi:pyruvate, water dikinase